MTRLLPTDSEGTGPPELGRRDVHLLAAKLAPPDLAHPTVPRQRLLSLLTRDVQRAPVTLVSGPPGSGKTVLAASWRQTQGAGRPVAWLSLDDYDDDPATFWAYVVQALTAAGVELTGLPVPPPGEPLPGWFVPELAGQIAARPRPVVLVLNDADLVADDSIIGGLDVLVRHAGSRLRLVLCARADPLLPLHQYRLAGTLAEIRGEQLGFTADETRDLLSAFGVPVSADVASALCAEAEGWAVGLRLAAAPLKQGTPPRELVTSLAHDDGSVAQYLFAEVLKNQAAQVRRFLLRTSVTAELWPDLVDQLSGRPNGRRTLTALAHANAFVEQSSTAPGGFRIHPLFREMLQAELSYHHASEVAELHRICARWYADAGRAPEAITHAVAARDWAFVVHLVHDNLLIARLLAHGNDAASRGLEALPSDLAGTEAAIIRAAVAVAAGRDPAGPDLTAAAGAAADRSNRTTVRVTAALTSVTASAFLDRTFDEGAVPFELATDLLDDLRDEQGRERREGLAVVATARAVAALRGGTRLDGVLDGLRAAATATHSVGSPRLRGRVVAQLAALEALDGHLRRAAQLADEAESLQADGGREEAHRGVASAAALAWVHLERYALVEARDWLGRAWARQRERPAHPESVTWAPLLAVVQGRLLRLRHEYDAAESSLREALEGARQSPWLHERVLVEVARLALARGQVEAGLALVQGTGEDMGWRLRISAAADLLRDDGGGAPLLPEQSGSFVDEVECQVVRACQLFAAGRVPEAAAELERALGSARPELLRWPFLDAPPQARRLLRTHPRLQGPAAWLSPSSVVPRPRAAGPQNAEPESEQLTQELSERELEVLTHLAEMLSTAEIAATMFISVNTVRTHIRSILRKLAVTRRNQAVRRGRQLGIL